MSRPYGRRPPYHRRDRLSFATVVSLVVAGALTVLAVLAAARAHAAPLDSDQQAFEYWAHHGSSVCTTLDRDPTINGIATAGLDIITKGHLSSKQAGLVVNYAVHYTCPQHQNLIEQFVASQTRRAGSQIA